MVERNQFLKWSSVEDTPKISFKLRMIFEFLPAGANTDVFDALELDWPVVCARDFEDYNTLAAVYDFMEMEMQTGAQQPGEPVFKVLIALLCFYGVKRRSDNFVSAILHSPDRVPVGLA